MCSVCVWRDREWGKAYNFISSIAKLRKSTCGLDGNGYVKLGSLRKNFKQRAGTGWGFEWPPWCACPVCE